VLAAAISVTAIPSLTVSAAWVKSSEGYSYKNEETGEYYTGWVTIGGYKYCFDSDGVAYTGFKKINSSYYYFNASKMGRMVTGWATINGNKYYFGTDGKMRAGKMLKINGETYYFKKNGQMATGKVKINGTTYDFGTDGKLVTSSTGSIYDPVSKVSWGDSIKSIVKTLGLKTGEYAITGNMLVVPTDTNDNHSAMYYICTEEDGLILAGEMKSISSLSAMKKYFSGWELALDEIDDGQYTAMYVKDSEFAFLTYNDEYCMTMLYAPLFLESAGDDDFDEDDLMDILDV